MSKVSISDAIGIAGIILAIILVVLDKAGKLKGGWLFVLLAVAAVMTLFLALGNQWVANAPAKWKWWLAALSASLVLFAYSGVAIWISGGDEEQTKTNAAEKQPTVDEMADAIAKKLPPLSEKDGVTDSVTAVISHAPPKSAQLSKPTPDPRLGIGPDAYRDISDEQVGQWAIEEADKIQELAERAMNSQMGSPSARTWHFTNDFNDCCAQDVKDLRIEILRRLGPSAKDSDEISAWTALFPETKYPAIEQFKPRQETNPMSAKHYAPYLRRLGLRLKRRAAPRSAPLKLQFHEQQLPPEKPEYSRIVVSIETDRVLSAGYIAVQFSGLPYSVGTDFKDSKLALDSRDSVDNLLVAELLKELQTSYVLQIGKTPFVPGKPIHVELRSASPIGVIAVTYFEE